MLSGIGPKDHLEQHGIEVVAVSPDVGSNLQEHPVSIQRWHSKIPTINQLGVGGILAALGNYVRNGSGPLSATVFHVQVMHRTDPSMASPNIQLGIANFASGGDKSRGEQNGFQVFTVLLHPRARGTLRLRSASPQDSPVIQHEMLGDRGDVRELLAGMAEARRIMAQAPTAEIVSGMFEREESSATKEDWESYARTATVGGAHSVGTCRMGSDASAVVGPDLRVNGVAALRVADTSILPGMPSGNTNAPAMMIGEVATDLILESV